MRKLLLGLIVLLLAVAGALAGQPAQPLAAQAEPLSPTSPAVALVDAAGFPSLDAGWQGALAAAVAAEGAWLPGPAPYTLTAFDTHRSAAGEEWALAVIAPAAVVESGWENLDLDQLSDVLLWRTADGQGAAHVRGHPAFLPLAAAAPRTLIDYTPFLAAQAAGGAAAPAAENYRFPWTAGQAWWLGGGWHSGYGADALDFGPYTAADPATNSAVLAAAGGVLRMACQNDGEQRLLWIEHPNGERTGYLHLDRASVAAAVEARDLVGQVVTQGTLLGTLYRGEAKIDGSCPANFPNCTFNTICGYGNAPHIHFILPNRTVTVDGYAAADLGSGKAGSRFTSSNTRQDAPVTPTPSPTPTATPTPSPTPTLAPDTAPPTALLVEPISGSLSITPAQDGTLVVQVVVTDTGGAGVAAGVADVQVQLAWQEAGGAWQGSGWTEAASAGAGTYTAGFDACTARWRVPHNRPLRISLDLADAAGNRAAVEAGVFRFQFPDLNRDCIVEIKDLFDLLPALADGAKARPEHDVDGSGSLDAADAAALEAAVYGGAAAGHVGVPAVAHVGVRTGQHGNTGQAVSEGAGPAGQGRRVQFTPLPPPALFASAREVAVSGSTVLAADWRAGGLTVADLSQIVSPTLLGVLPLGDRTFGVNLAGSLAIAGDTPDGDPARLSLISLRGLVQPPTETPALTPTLPLTQSLVATLTLPGELMGSAVAGDHLYLAAGYAGLHVLDVSTPQTPTLVSTFDTPGIAADVHVGLTAGVTAGVTGTILYVADQGGGLRIYRSSEVTVTAPVTATGTITPGLPITPVLPITPSTKLSLTLLAAWPTPGEAIGVTAVQTVAYVAASLGGVQIVDVADPAAPRLLATYATTSAANGVLVSGSLLYVAAGWQGVLALDVSDPATPRLAGSIAIPGYAHDLVLTNDLLLVAAGPAGLQLLQVSQPAEEAWGVWLPLAAKE